MKKRTKKRIKDIIFTVVFIAMVLYLIFGFQVWLAGYDSLYQYFNMIR